MSWGFSLVLVLLGHVIADFYAQTNKVSEKKEEHVRYLVIHDIFYALCMIPFLLVVFPVYSGLLAWLIISLSHALIDWIKIKLAKRRNLPLIAFCTDQALHVGICMSIVAILRGGSPVLDVVSPVISSMGVDSAMTVLVAVVTLFVLWRPAAIFVQLVLGSVRSGTEESAASKNEAQQLKAGRWIGMLERTLIATLTLYGQFDAIAFVLAAKSIARFKQLDDQEFAECYLVGTLASTAVAIVVTLTVRGMVGWN